MCTAARCDEAWDFHPYPVAKICTRLTKVAVVFSRPRRELNSNLL